MHRTRSVLFTGEGPNFCAGGDVKTFAAQGDGLPDYLREATTWLGNCTLALMRLRDAGAAHVPVLGVVRGVGLSNDGSDAGSDGSAATHAFW